MHNLFFVATLVVLVKGAPHGAYKPFKPDEDFLESVSHLPFEVDANKDGYIDFDEYEDLFDALYPRVHPTPSTPFVDYWDMFYYVKKHIRNLDCSNNTEESYFSSYCNIFKTTPFSNMTIYTAYTLQFDDLNVIFPDGRKSKDTFHAVVAVDVMSDKGFGHPLLIMYLFKTSNKSECRKHGGKPIEKGRFCLRTSLDGSKSCRSNEKCEEYHLPLVYSTETYEKSGAKTQILRCDLMKPFAFCPEETWTVDLGPPSDPCKEGQPIENCYKPIKCESESRKSNQAVTLFGGWNENAALSKHELNLYNVYKKLMKASFKEENIKVFFNSTVSIDKPYVHKLEIVKKGYVRSYLKNVCQSSCVKSFVVYLNGPTLEDGSVLLWDGNHNGIADKEEKYSPEEIFDDLSSCQADHIFIIADQSFSYKLTEEFQKRSLPSKYSLLAIGDRKNPYNFGKLSTKILKSLRREPFSFWPKVLAANNIVSQLSQQNSEKFYSISGKIRQHFNFVVEPRLVSVNKQNED